MGSPVSPLKGGDKDIDYISKYYDQSQLQHAVIISHPPAERSSSGKPVSQQTSWLSEPLSLTLKRHLIKTNINSVNNNNRIECISTFYWGCGYK